MPRFYFDVQDGENISRDDKGLDFPSLERAQHQAAQALGEWVRFASPGPTGRQMTVEIRDRSKTLLLRMTLKYEVEHQGLGGLH
jgi:hypothetical protein